MKNFALCVGFVLAFSGLVLADQYTDDRDTADSLKALALDDAYYAGLLVADVEAAKDACIAAKVDAENRGCSPSQLAPGTADKNAADALRSGANTAVTEGGTAISTGNGFYNYAQGLYAVNDIPYAIAEMGNAIDNYTNAGGFYGGARQDRESAIANYEAAQAFFESQNP
jgi:hypothetical protein